MSAVMRQELQKLAMIRETFIQGQPAQAFVAAWWAGLVPPDRRTLLAWCGLDDSAANAGRPWEQYLKQDRDALIVECARLHRMTEGVKWAA